VNVLCKICNKRRARRHCPGIEADICPQCCGTERENTIDCPLTCEFLIESRLHENPPSIDPEKIPNLDIRLSDKFVSEHELPVMWMSAELARAMEDSKAVDNDTREALDSLIQIYKARRSGLIYDGRSTNPYAADIQTKLQASIEKLENRFKESGTQTLAEKDVLETLVFLQRIELQHNNGRRRGRAFMQFLTTHFPAPPAVEAVEET
jgi:hypothetical protein